MRGHTGVEIVGARVRGYRVGLHAEDAGGLVVERASFRDLWRQRLGSTATREDPGDWLWPHRNDNDEWLERYAAAVWIKNSDGVRVTGTEVRRGQNGIVLSGSDDGVVRGNDCSFLSGWGLAMWRASGHEITENRFDFCVRGHVEGVYNRGQDSAGILMFEACRDNRVVSNSATHSGDGVFGFGGNDAIETVQEGPWGNANNRFIANDLSFAPAHGLEMTFSEGNLIDFNLFEGNAICGIWAGYSQDTRILDNLFIANGGMAYGRERGGINIEHGAGNTISRNRFINNKVGVRLWWDHDVGLLAKPGVVARYRGVRDNEVWWNHFVMQAGHPFAHGGMAGVEIEDIGDAPGYDGPRVGSNLFERSQNFWEIEEGAGIDVAAASGELRPKELPEVMFGRGFTPARPERIHPSGREWIVVDAWGPWDFQTPLLREHARSGGADRFEVYVPVGSDVVPEVEIEGAAVVVEAPSGDEGWRPWVVTVTPEPGSVVSAYQGVVRVGDWSRRIDGRLVDASWSVRAWAWETDPLADVDAWRAEAAGVEAVELGHLDLPFGHGGPAGVEPLLGVRARDRFGLLAEAQIALPAGRWRVRTLSDDGVRVFVDGVMVIERWDIHGPTEDAAEFEVTGDGPTRIGVEYFENAGYAVLRVGIEAAE
ncbi:MAG: right-handed parallel beta-helix repeat-containing protein [Planctomycetes bacterium]|nr:right-handed parallel beta-helix repeat-containing protein [Planctomycetota bacterium]